MTVDRSDGSRESIDELDHRLIRLLQKNGRTSNTELGRVLGVTEATVRKRIARLTDSGLLHVVAVPTPRAVGFTVSAIIGIRCRPGTSGSVGERLSEFAEVRYVGLSLGRYDVLVEAFFSDNEHLLRFVSDDLGILDGIVSVESSMILKVAKFSYEWEVP